MANDAESRQKLIRYGILAVVLLLLLVSLGWNMLSADPGDVRATTPKTSDFVVTWRCLECDHQEEDYAGQGPRACPECGKEALYASVMFSCPEHGLFPVAFNYDADGKPTEVKVADGPWVPYMDISAGQLGTVCPVCGQSMMPAESPRRSKEPLESGMPDEPAPE